jgi:hypothetical protein
VDQVKSKSKVDVVQNGKDINKKSKSSSEKRSIGGHVETNYRPNEGRLVVNR